MSDVFGDTNKVATAFTGFGGKVAIVDVIENVFPPVKTKQWTDVGGRTGEPGHRDVVVRATNSVVQYETNIEEAE